MTNQTVKLQKKTRRLVLQENVSAYVFMAPFLIFFVMFVLYPMFLCVWTSFFDANMGVAEDKFIGFANYQELFKDEVFWIGLKNTLVIVFVSVPVTCAFSLWVASAIAKMPVAATSAFRCIFYLPVVTGSVAVTVVWKWMFSKFSGIINMLGWPTEVVSRIRMIQPRA